MATLGRRFLFPRRQAYTHYTHKACGLSSPFLPSPIGLAVPASGLFFDQLGSLLSSTLSPVSVVLSLFLYRSFSLCRSFYLSLSLSVPRSPFLSLSLFLLLFLFSSLSVNRSLFLCVCLSLGPVQSNALSLNVIRQCLALI